MARRRRAAAEPLPAGLTPEVLDQLVAGVETPADSQVVWRQLQKAMAERVLKAELTHHLGYLEEGARRPAGNARNGFTPKSLLTDTKSCRSNARVSPRNGKSPASIWYTTTPKLYKSRRRSITSPTHCSGDM